MSAIPQSSLSLTPNALTVLRRRYLKKDSRGEPVESPAEMFWRVADNVAQAERRYGHPSAKQMRTWTEAFFSMMTRLEFLPNSPTLMNAGRDLQQLSACFVLPVQDSLESIFDAVKQQALIHQSGGGTGFSFSQLRPRNDRVDSTSGVASGPLSFMRVFNMATEVIKQGGTRRGANMGILRVDHPDILDFIGAKQDPRELANFNISVGLTDAFMRALEKYEEYPLVNPHTKKKVGRLKAAEVFDRLVEAAWHTGEPGVVFLDTINRRNPTPHIGRIEATNPCGEQPLLSYESCTLGSINLGKYLTGSPLEPRIDFDRLGETTRLAVRFLDDVLDMNRYPLPEIEDVTKGNRRIGLGVMGFADLLIQLNISYDSEEAVQLGEKIMRFIREQGHLASAHLAKERGTFPNFRGSRLAAKGLRLRNATVTTVAPTGTISIIADCSPGIEPIYGISFVRTVMENVRLTSLHPAFIRHATDAGVYSPQLVDRIAANESIQHLTDLPASLRRLFVTAHDIPAEQHVRMQAAFQKYSDSGVSKTINLPAKATKEDVAHAFTLAYRLGCKGLTVYRTGSRDKQVMACTNVQFC